MLLFDLGGVLLRYKDEWCVRAFARRLGVPYARAWRAFPYHRRALQAGEVDLRGFWSGFCQSLELPAPGEGAALWTEELERRGSADGNLLRYARGLQRNGWRVGVLSNTDLAHVRVFRRRGWFSGLSPELYSFELGAVKPSARLFRAVERKLGERGPSLLLIDDRPRNVRAARKRGWQAVRFTRLAELRRALRARGIE